MRRGPRGPHRHRRLHRQVAMLTGLMRTWSIPRQGLQKEPGGGGCDPQLQRQVSALPELLAVPSTSSVAHSCTGDCSVAVCWAFRYVKACAQMRPATGAPEGRNPLLGRHFSPRPRPRLSATLALTRSDAPLAPSSQRCNALSLLVVAPAGVGRRGSREAQTVRCARTGNGLLHSALASSATGTGLSADDQDNPTSHSGAGRGAIPRATRHTTALTHTSQNAHKSQPQAHPACSYRGPSRCPSKCRARRPQSRRAAGPHGRSP
jgi:hypothetical protein